MIPTGVENFKDLFTGDQISVYIIISIMNAVLLFCASMKFLLVLQQCGYRGRRYFKWLSNKETPYRSRLMLLCMLAFLFFGVLNLCFTPVAIRFFGDRGESVASYFGLGAYILFTGLYIKTESSVNAKVPLKKTKRMLRLCVTYMLFLIIFS